VRADAPLPPVRSRVHIALPSPEGDAAEVQGEVVRHVTPSDAARWRMAPGFAVELGALSGRQRAALEALAARLAAPGGSASGPATGTAASAAALSTRTIEELERRAALGLYEALGARSDSGFPEIRERARAVRREIEALRPSLPAVVLSSRVPALLARIDAAAAQLGTPAERIMLDARRGNFQGVAHCVTAGMPSAVIAERRRTFLAEDPGRAERAQRDLARARMAAKLGNREGALAAYEAALGEDPLDLALHEAYWALRRAGE
jgi:serine/threonine-protein kinase